MVIFHSYVKLPEGKLVASSLSGFGFQTSSQEKLDIDFAARKYAKALAAVQVPSYVARFGCGCTMWKPPVMFDGL
jgi:hypothetical protein